MILSSFRCLAHCIGAILKLDHCLQPAGAQPWFGAWSPAIPALVAGTVLGGLLMSWGPGLDLFLPAWLLAFLPIDTWSRWGLAAERGCP